MNNNELKTVTVGGKEFSVVKLDPWKRLTFIADLQKEFLAPAINKIGQDEVAAMFNAEGEKRFDVLAILSTVSSLIDGSRLEYWTKRILAEGLVIYTREDGQRAKLAFSEMTSLFTNPADILLLLKDVVVFNMEDITGLMSSFNPAEKITSKVNIVKK